MEGPMDLKTEARMDAIAMTKRPLEPMRDGFNQARIGLAIVGGIALAGLLLLLVAEAGGGQNWLFNLFLLISIGILALYVKVVYRTQQHLRERVEGAER